MPRLDRRARGLRPEGPVEPAESRGTGQRQTRIITRLRTHDRSRPMTLPGSPHIAYRGDDLFIEGRSVAALAREHGTPLYAYSQASML